MILLLEVKLLYDPVCPFIGLSRFPKRARIFTPMFLPEHLSHRSTCLHVGELKLGQVMKPDYRNRKFKKNLKAGNDAAMIIALIKSTLLHNDEKENENKKSSFQEYEASNIIRMHMFAICMTVESHLTTYNAITILFSTLFWLPGK